MNAPCPKSQDLIEHLKAFGDLKVWSVLVTIFGDLAPDAGDQLSGPTLSEIADQIGIKPEALRVALHRLRKDGWITSHKKGRVGYYSLSENAQKETNAVKETVYEKSVNRINPWYLVLTETSAPTQSSQDWIQIEPSQFLFASLPTPTNGMLVSEINNSDLPIWLRNKVISPDTSNYYEKLETVLQQHINLDDHASAIEKLALRILILHNWRRLVLRHTLTHAAAMGTDWIGARCRTMVGNALDQLPKTNLNLLD